MTTSYFWSNSWNSNSTNLHIIFCFFLIIPRRGWVVNRLPCLQSAVYSISELKADSENECMSTILEMNNYLTGFNLGDVIWDLQWVFAVVGGVGWATDDSNPVLCFFLCKPGVLLVPVYVLPEVWAVTALVLGGGFLVDMQLGTSINLFSCFSLLELHIPTSQLLRGKCEAIIVDE